MPLTIISGNVCKVHLRGTELRSPILPVLESFVPKKPNYCFDYVLGVDGGYSKKDPAGSALSGEIPS